VLTARACPVCGNTDETRVRFPERIDNRRLTAMSYASRKEPEYMSLRMVICPGCDLLYAPRVPTAQVLAAAYAETGYDSGTEARYAADSYARALRARLGRGHEGSAALEIGTGNGALLAHLRGFGFTEVLGIEPSRAAADSAEPDVRPRIRVEGFDAGRLPQSHFALVVANQTLEHVENPYELLEAARGLLRPGGMFMVVSHNFRHPLMRLLGARSPIIDIGHLQVFSPKSLEFALKRARFGSVEIRPFANRYPLHYWVRLMPIPQAIKRPLHRWLRRGAGRGTGLEARVGNMVAWATA
jgi:SAM-dependent methyltransferase